MAPTAQAVLDISPPLLNSANPWATTLEDLRGLYACKSTGAVTTRTSLTNGFGHDPEKHRYIFFNSADHASHGVTAAPDANATLNSLGYSPLTLDTYLGFIKTIASETPDPVRKWFIVSVTGTPEQVLESYRLILATRAALPAQSFPLAMEINLSCPNIPGSPPPAYSGPELARYLSALRSVVDRESVPVGLKTPPYTHAGDFNQLVAALADASNGGACPVDFLTSTNTLGSCLVLGDPALPGSGMGGMAGAPLHPLALGNVATLRRLLDARPEEALRRIQMVGVGGVADAAGYRRMRAVGAAAVGVGTALGLKGLGVFEEIEKGLDGEW